VGLVEVVQSKEGKECSEKEKEKDKKDKGEVKDKDKEQLQQQKEEEEQSPIIVGYNIMSLYEGLGSNMLKEGPPSALYLGVYESVKYALLPQFGLRIITFGVPTSRCGGGDMWTYSPSSGRGD